MKLERSLRDEEIKELMRDPEMFSVNELERLKNYLIKKGNIDLGKPFGIIGKVCIDVQEKKVYAVVEDLLKEETLLDVTYNESTGQYNLFALLHGVEEKDIKISKYGSILEITAGGYTGRARIPENIREVSKTYKNGVLTVKLM